MDWHKYLFCYEETKDVVVFRWKLRKNIHSFSILLLTGKKLLLDSWNTLTIVN